MIEGPTIRSSICVSGHRLYLFYDEYEKRWETQTERQDRLATIGICERCEDEFHIPALSSNQGNRPHFCPRCLKSNDNKTYTKAYRNGGRKPGTTWGMFQQHEQRI